MKTKIVLWGENEKDEKLLLGIELIEAENLVKIYCIPEQQATEEFYNSMMTQWRSGTDITWPEQSEEISRPLSMTEGLLPDNLKTQRQDILARAKTEWHFVVLSSKLYATYADEIQEFKEKVEHLTDFDGSLWEEMKGFWSKVQAQVYEKNLFREHAIELRSRTDEIFEQLKSLRKAANDELEKASRVHLNSFLEKLNSIEERIEKGLGLQPIFNELKDIQREFKNVKLTRKHHNDVWKKIDTAFKAVKEKKYGEKASQKSGALGRLESRYNGLLNAIEKMERSISRDRKDLAFQKKRIDRTDGQLELQIRQAKMAMIEERVNSKQVKLDDMLKTKVELESRIGKEKKKEEARIQKKEREAQLKKAKAEVKESIADDIAAREDELSDREKELQEAAEKLKAIKQKRAKAAKQKEEPVVAAAPVSESVVEITEVESADVAPEVMQAVTAIEEE